MVFASPQAPLSRRGTTASFTGSLGKGCFSAVVAAEVSAGSVTIGFLFWLASLHQIDVIEKLPPHMVQLYIPEAGSGWALRVP